MIDIFWKRFAVIALTVISISIILHGALPRYRVMSKPTGSRSISCALDTWTGKTRFVYISSKGIAFKYK